MSTQAKVDRAISLTRKLVPGFDQKVQRAVSDISKGSANGARQLIQSATEAMRGKEGTPEAKELVRLGRELARKK